MPDLAEVIRFLRRLTPASAINLNFYRQILSEGSDEVEICFVNMFCRSGYMQKRHCFLPRFFHPGLLNNCRLLLLPSGIEPVCDLIICSDVSEHPVPYVCFKVLVPDPVVVVGVFWIQTFWRARDQPSSRSRSFHCGSRLPSAP